MKTLSLVLCCLIATYGCITAFTSDFVLGSVILIIGSLSFLIIDYKTQKIRGYNKKSFMNR